MPTEPSWPIYSLKLKSRKDLFTFPGLCTNGARPALLDQRGFRENGHRCVNRRHHLLHHRVGLPLLWPESDARASHELCLVSLIEGLEEDVTRERNSPFGHARGSDDGHDHSNGTAKGSRDQTRSGETEYVAKEMGHGAKASSRERGGDISSGA